MGVVEKKAGLFVFFLQVVFLVLLGVFGRYDAQASSLLSANNDDANNFHPTYGMFQDVHIMIFVGFGFLMTFLKRYGYSAVGFNFLLAALTLQWAIIVQGLIHMYEEGASHFHVDIKSMVSGDFAAAVVLISFGVLLGKASPLQLTLMAVLEVIFYAVNIHIGEVVFGASDAGGSMFIHAFGAYFGLAVSLAMKQPWHKEHPFEGSNYHSDLFAMIGTLFLWICWPSFNGALLAPGEQQHRTAINTYFSLAACVLASFALSALVSKKARLDMVHIQNATLAGGVAIGTLANFMVQPWVAGCVGFLAGCVSVVGYAYITPLLSSKLGLHDTCGVHNLHGMPGLIAGIAGIVGAAVAEEDAYGKDGLVKVFPARGGDEGISAGGQAGMQAAALGATLGIALVGGLVTGVLLRFLKFLDPVPMAQGFSDMPYWEVPDADGEDNEEAMVVVAQDKVQLTQ